MLRLVKYRLDASVLETLGLIVVLASLSLSCQGEMIKARSGVVATDETICSKVGRDVLVSGGHAVDAAVAAALCLGVVNPPFSGLGGGGFMLVRQASGEAKVFDMKEMAPKRAHRDMFKATDHMAKQQGPLSIAIPGELAGLYLAWKAYGKLPWNRLVSPAESLARNGFKVSRFLYELLTHMKKVLGTNKALSEVFMPKGRLIQEGHTLRQVNLANTLLEISKNGMSTFYDGPVGRNLTRDVLGARGILSMEDLQSYRVKIREPIQASVMGLKILAAPPPATGGAMMILILNILSQYGLPKGASGALGLHRTIEALKYALAMRMELGDPEFVDTQKTLASMLSTRHAAKLRKLIKDNSTFEFPHYGSKWEQIRDHGTTHVCVVDSKRNVVSMTTSINYVFGSTFMSPSTGIILNNQMSDFSIPSGLQPAPAPKNLIVPLKRPLSSMTPTIILQGKKVKAVVGAAGGILIPDAVTQVVLNYFTRKMDPLASVMAPRYYHFLRPNMLLYENYTWMGNQFRAPLQTIEFLKSRHHRVVTRSSWDTVCQFVVQELKGNNSGLLYAVSEPRKGGTSAGY